jgi:hypothetical protein
MYRSSVGVYPASLTFGTGSLTDTDGNIYMTKLPQDPQPAKYGYYYESTAPYSDYVLGTYTEGAGTSCSSLYSCTASASVDSTMNLPLIKSAYAAIPGPGTGGVNCNYCLGPLGPK